MGFISTEAVCMVVDKSLCVVLVLIVKEK